MGRILAAGDLRDGRGLREWPGDAVDLAPLQRHGPATRRAPRGQRGHQIEREQVAPGQDDVGEQVLGDPSGSGELVEERLLQVGDHLGQRGAVRRDQRRDGCGPLRVGPAVDEHVGAVAGDRVSVRPTGNLHPGVLCPGARRGGHHLRDLAQAREDRHRGGRYERQGRPLVDLGDDHLRRVGVLPRQVERGGGIDEGAVQVDRGDHGWPRGAHARQAEAGDSQLGRLDGQGQAAGHVVAAAPTAIPSAPVAPRVKFGWISPTQL